MMKAIAYMVAGASVILAAAGCGGGSSSPSAPTFTPSGDATTKVPAGGGSQTPATPRVAASGYVMPPFGKNVHIEMTSWVPGNRERAAAVNAEKDYQLAFLYSEYKGGNDQSWISYVTPQMQLAVAQELRDPGVTTESFTGTIRYFDMTVFADPAKRGDLDVSSCFDNAKSSNTNLRTGAVLPSTGSADQHYIRITDELRKDSAGQWKVVANLPAVYYPRAKECKP